MRRGGLKKEIKNNPVDQVQVGKREILDGVAARAVNHDGGNVLARRQLGGGRSRDQRYLSGRLHIGKLWERIVLQACVVFKTMRAIVQARSYCIQSRAGILASLAEARRGSLGLREE